MDNSNFVEHPRNQIHYRFLAYFMTMMSVGCQSWWGFPAPNKFFKKILHVVKLLVIPIPVSEILYVYLHFNEMPFETLCNILCTVWPALAINVKILTTYFHKFKEVVKCFMETYHLFHYLNDNEYNGKILLKVEKISKITIIAVFSSVMLTGCFWLLLPFFYNINNRTEITLNKAKQFQSALYLVMPFDFLYDFNGMFAYYFFNIIFVIIYIGFIPTFEVVTYIIIYHLIGHIVILKNEIKTKFRDNLTEDEVKAVIVQIIEHHNFIIKAFKDVQSAFGLSVSASYLANLITNSFYTYLVMFSDPEKAVQYCLTLVIFFGGSAVTSIIFEEIRIQCYDLSEILYNVPWENMSISNQKSILIMLAQMQRPLIFVAAGGLVAGIQPLIFITKTTFSYYVMLKSVA